MSIRGSAFVARAWWLAAGFVVLTCAWESGIARAQTAIDQDPDPEHHPTLHLQPPLISPLLRSESVKAPTSVINGITYIDVMLASGFDLPGDDRGNEPAITANPVNPNQIVLTSFAGSAWGSGGNSSIFYSGDGGMSWTKADVVPPPPGFTSDFCPCDQTLDWGRNGVLYATFLDFNPGRTMAAVFSAQASNPTDPLSWVYNAPGGVAQTTNLSSLIYVDQPWLWSGPLPTDNAQTNVCVAYDNFDVSYTNSQTRAADSPGASPLDFTRDAATDADGSQYNDSMNPGNRIAVGPDGKIFTIYQRLVDGTNPVKQLTYIVNVSTDGGQTWSVANSDHPSGGKIVAANVYSFQGNGSKVGGVNAMLGGVDAITVDKNGAAWVVYGSRPTTFDHDGLTLQKVTYSSGNLTLGPAVNVTSSTVDNYLPGVAVLPNGEVGVLHLTYNASTSNFQWRFAQYTNGTTLVKATVFPAFTSPFSDSGASNYRIFGDYIQVRAVGCNFYGTYPARGAGANSVSSIEPYFMSAPSANACSLPTLTAILPTSTCAGGPGFSLALQGTGYTNGATGRANGSLRTTSFLNSTRVNIAMQASDIASPGTVSIDLLGSLPAGGLTGSQPLTVLPLPASPADTLRADHDPVNVNLSWATCAAATSYNVKRCIPHPRPCTPVAYATSPTPSYPDPSFTDGNDYWYTVESADSCGSVP